MNTDWFKKAGWGVFVHHLSIPPSSVGGQELTVEEWNRQVDGFDVCALAEQLSDAGAGYAFLTIGQNSGFFNSPNATYDRLVGRDPSRCSRRDLVLDFAKALGEKSIPLLAYLPSHAPACDRLAVEGLKCTPSWDASAWQLKPGSYINSEDCDEKLSAFQQNWEAVIREWSLRWGESVCGWWFDGCYYFEKMYSEDSAPNFYSFAGAARAGNEKSIVAFNAGVKPVVRSITPAEDYTAGELNRTLDVGDWRWDIGCLAEGKQYHVLSFLGDGWCRGEEPRFPDKMVAGYTEHIIAKGGVISWDVPIDMRGHIPEQFISQLKNLKGLRGR